jgi:hypothetical protein
MCSPATGSIATGPGTTKSIMKIGKRYCVGAVITKVKAPATKTTRAANKTAWQPSSCKDRSLSKGRHPARRSCPPGAKVNAAEFPWCGAAEVMLAKSGEELADFFREFHGDALKTTTARFGLQIAQFVIDALRFTAPFALERVQIDHPAHSSAAEHGNVARTRSRNRRSAIPGGTAIQSGGGASAPL